MESVKKYILTNEILEHDGHLLHRIQAVVNFGYVNAGDLGGWIESEDNLSHHGDCWVADNAKVYEKGKKVYQKYAKIDTLAL